MLEPKRLQAGMVGAALEQAKHYRLLNEPAQAESICRDIVAVQPENREAQINLLLSLTDQFPERYTNAFEQAVEVLENIGQPLYHAYYEGIIYERWGRAQQTRGVPIDSVVNWVHRAMRCYELAIEAAPNDDPDPLLRWNTCARFLNEYDSPQHAASYGSVRDIHEEFGGDDVPVQ